MLQFLRKTKVGNLPLEFCKSMQTLWSTSKKTIFSQLPIDILSGRTSYESVWGCPLNLPQHNCRLFLNHVFQRWRLKTTGQVSPVQFSCNKGALDEARSQPVLSCLSRRLCYLISESIPCTIELKMKQIRK